MNVPGGKIYTVPFEENEIKTDNKREREREKADEKKTHLMSIIETPLTDIEKKER